MTATTDREPDTTETIEQPSDNETDTLDGPETDDAGTGRRWPWKRYLGAALLIAVYAGAFGGAGALGWRLLDVRAVQEAGRAARQTAINYAETLTSIDSTQVDQNFSAVLAGATGEFKDTYTKASVQLRQLLVDNKATAHGTVVESGIESETRNRVVVLLMIDQTVDNAARPDGRVDRSRMKMTLEKVDGRWLASKVELP
ncbi:Mce associated membrane protein [Mycobacterium nebraskense]|uniref:hypothetical protein n=1 Tax=Mycobacterium nebraskense TaxID=244292 RepID=UPI0006422025|nr:hypothetical protein [Mycobacterium nebraskense]KLO39311.1 Mce associated membrane protein [Mycobacterium nebraskense]